MLTFLVATPAMSINAGEAAAKQAWLAKQATPGYGPPSTGWVAPTAAPNVASAPPPVAYPETPTGGFVAAPLDYFRVDLLTPKGPRRDQGSLVDVGDPCDFSRPLVPDTQWSNARVGSWACTEGGWDSPKLRPTTETFLVVEGAGSVTDADGMIHPFGPNDVVVLPKNWNGRWDVTQGIHKLWVVHDHPDVSNPADGVVRAVVSPVWSCFAPDQMPAGILGSSPGAPVSAGTPVSAGSIVYDLGPTKVGFWSCSPGSFEVTERTTAEIFWVIDGVFFLTNSDTGQARRCSSGDTVVLPKGWAGHWDVIEPVRKVWVEVQ